jgi:hypothetical protein
MEHQSRWLMPQRSVLLTLVCSLGLLAFFLLTILPNQKALRRLENETAHLKARLAEQEVLLPVYRKFYEVIDSTRTVKVSRLAFPAPQSLSADQAAGIETVFRAMAAAAGLKARQMSPELNSIINASQSLRLVISANGNMENIRRFLLKLGELPYLTQVESIRIQQAGPDGDLELNTQVLLAQTAAGDR